MNDKRDALLKSLEKTPINDIVASIEEREDLVDTYTYLGKLNQILEYLKSGIAVQGTIVTILGQAQETLEFGSDPQVQLNNLSNLINTNKLQLEGQIEAVEALVDALDATKADVSTVATNAENIVNLGLTKQDKLSQVDLDNIAKINQFLDLLNTKADKTGVMVVNSDPVSVNSATADTPTIFTNVTDEPFAHGVICLYSESSGNYIQIKIEIGNNSPIIWYRQNGIRGWESWERLLDSLDIANFTNKLNEKQNFATEKVDTVPQVTGIESLHKALYDLRKSPTRHYQLQEAEAKRVLKILGYPTGLSEDTNIFLYFDIPYSEAGGFEIVITAMGRNSSHLYKRTMYSTLNANWQDTGWTDMSSPMASKGDISELENAKQDKRVLLWSGQTREPIVLDKYEAGKYFALEVYFQLGGLDGKVMTIRINLDRYNPSALINGGASVGGGSLPYSDSMLIANIQLAFSPKTKTISVDYAIGVHKNLTTYNLFDNPNLYINTIFRVYGIRR